MIDPVDVIGPVIVAVHVNGAAHVGVADAVSDRRQQVASDRRPPTVALEPMSRSSRQIGHGLGFGHGVGPVHVHSHDHVGDHDHGCDHGGHP